MAQFEPDCIGDTVQVYLIRPESAYLTQLWSATMRALDALDMAERYHTLPAVQAELHLTANALRDAYKAAALADRAARTADVDTIVREDAASHIYFPRHHKS